MRNVFRRDVDPRAFLERATRDGYSMEEHLIEPSICRGISSELQGEGFLEDLVELEPTSEFRKRGMMNAFLLHSALNNMISTLTFAEEDANFLPFFSVRVFEPGQYGTTVHRNHPTIGPWAIGTTLNGNAPFNVYRQDQLARNTVLPLKGDSTDPIPLETIETSQGTGWALYTENELVPHSSGIVDSNRQRELLILYGFEEIDYLPNL